MAHSARAAAALALVLALKVPAATAQDAGAGARSVASRHLALALAASRVSLLDPVASPLRYDGGGGAVAAAYGGGSAHGGTAWELALAGEISWLGSPLPAAERGRERALFASASALWLRRAAGRGPVSLLLGGEAQLQGAFRAHRYAEPGHDFYYGLAALTLAPALRGRLARPGGGELRLDVAAPLVGLAYRPYGDLAFARGGIRPRLAAPPTLAGLDAGVAWALPLGRAGTRVLLAWRLSYLRYRDHELYRSARDRMSAALELPLGAER